MTEELQALEKTHTWDLVDLPHGKSAIGCKWVYKIKTKSDGCLERYKARLVAKGYAQEYGIDYEETFAPVARTSRLFRLSDKVCLLHRALYGLKQAPRAWFAKFSSIVHQFGFSSSSHDTTLFIRRSTPMILLLLYVDDMIITGDDHSGISDFKLFLHQQFEMKDLGHLSYFLGLELMGKTADASSFEKAKGKWKGRTKGTGAGKKLKKPTIDATAPEIPVQPPVEQEPPLPPPVVHDLNEPEQGEKQQPRKERGRTETPFVQSEGNQSLFEQETYRALADTTSELLALRWLLEDMGVTHSSPTVIHCDNRSAIQIAHNDVFHERTKHIEIDCHLVRHHLSAGILHLLPVSSSDQTADIFTKTFPPGRFRDLVSKLKMASVKPP
uniref:Reverse transcriptase Ty1/copia-type domain-containing protein n=1 Tax=Fagus sylvatica TaxID=28930 RepID=A0A2N9GM47_FAGSY